MAEEKVGGGEAILPFLSRFREKKEQQKNMDFFAFRPGLSEPCCGFKMLSFFPTEMC